MTQEAVKAIRDAINYWKKFSAVEEDYAVLRKATLALDSLPDHKETLAAWMMQNSIATGHGDTFEDLLQALKIHMEGR